MTSFIIAASLLSLLAIGFLAWPLLRGRTGMPRAARAAVLVAIVLGTCGAALYTTLGNSALASGQSASGASASNQTISTLARRVERDPNDLDGWLELGQAYGAIGNYSLALRCYEHANRLSAGSSAAALEGMAEAMLMGGDSGQSAKAAELLDRALQLDPHSPKALFYSGLSAYQQGDLRLARERFAAMLALGPPEAVRTALQRQLDDIDAQLSTAPAAAGKGSAALKAGAAPAAATAVAPAMAPAMAPAVAPAAATGDGKGGVGIDSATAIHLHVTIAPALAAKVPAEAALFVFVRAPSGGPPLAVKRSELRLPQDVDLSAADSMVAGRSVQPGQDVAVVARISASGSPLPQSGDLFGEIHTVAGKGGAQALQIDKLNP